MSVAFVVCGACCIELNVVFVCACLLSNVGIVLDVLCVLRVVCVRACRVCCILV